MFIKNDKSLFCVNCISENLPFINNPNEVDVNFIPTDFQEKLFNELNTAINDNSFDLNIEGDETNSFIDCKYYNYDKFSEMNFNQSKSFSILHYNIHSIERHIEEFRIALSLFDFQYDIICISESKLRKDCEPKVDISIEGYQSPVGTSTEATKGGVLIYAKIGINFKPRNDLILYKKRNLNHFLLKLTTRVNQMI